MNGVVILKSNRSVIGRVNDVFHVDGGNVTGKRDAIKGIDLTVADVVITDVDIAAFKLGDILPQTITDKRGQLPETDAQKIASRLSDVEVALADVFTV